MKIEIKAIFAILKLTTFFAFFILFSNCAKDKCQGSTYNKNIDKSYLIDIMPYSDTSTRLFLKNGKDTLLFTSQGLKEEIIKDYSGEGSYDAYNLQQFSLKMAASDTDFFEIKYFATRKIGKVVTLKINNFDITEEYDYSDFRYYYPPIIKEVILNNNYDTVLILPLKSFGNLFIKPKLGILKIETSKNIYELIK